MQPSVRTFPLLPPSSVTSRCCSATLSASHRSRRSATPRRYGQFLSGYFELSRAIVGRYGGRVEKFIGDAVMAVWGALIAKEDDAERAVRAGLELVSAVVGYGSGHRTDLQARVGIADRRRGYDRVRGGGPCHRRPGKHGGPHPVGRPSRVPVTSTQRPVPLTAASIAYNDAGEHHPQGKSRTRSPLPGDPRSSPGSPARSASEMLEAPFMGRDHELRLVKELFHASAERQSARMVLVSGVAGVGKSRLAWRSSSTWTA